MANSFARACLIALVIAVILYIALCVENPNAEGFASPNTVADLAVGFPYGFSMAAADPATTARNRMWRSEEVDPEVTGQLYAGARAGGAGRRLIYGSRTAPGARWGLREFSTGVPGEPGVDVGLLGLREYSLDGLPDVFDDGIPENWRMPSTPLNWYAPRQQDYYDVEAGGPAVYAEALMSLQEPDHDPLTS